MGCVVKLPPKFAKSVISEAELDYKDARARSIWKFQFGLIRARCCSMVFYSDAWALKTADEGFPFLVHELAADIDAFRISLEERGGAVKGWVTRNAMHAPVM